MESASCALCTGIAVFVFDYERGNRIHMIPMVSYDCSCNNFAGVVSSTIASVSIFTRTRTPGTSSSYIGALFARMPFPIKS